MRARSVAPVAAFTLAMVSLVGCSNGDGSADETTDEASSLCSAVTASGSAADSVEVSGEVGAPAEATIDAPLEIPEPQRAVVVEGDGEQLAEGDLVEYAITLFDATTGEQLATMGYDDPMLPATLATGSGADEFFGCSTIGSRIVMALPADASGSTGAVYVIDVLDTVSAVADGAEQEVTAGLPTVTLSDKGVPEVEVPGTAAPAELQTAVLKLGDGATVEAGSQVLVQYTGVKWSDGTVFDSSWDRGTPATFSTDGVVDGFRDGLVGQTVGSQVLIVIPPALGYGADEGNELQNETLVFVVDILATQPAYQH